MPPFSAPGAPALRALCEAAQHDKVKTIARVRRLSATVTWKDLGTVSPTAQQLLCRDCARWDRVIWLRRGPPHLPIRRQAALVKKDKKM